MKIAAVVVTFNRLNYLQKTLSSTLNEQVDYVIVVNNASSDGTQGWLTGLDEPRLKVLNLERNVGGAGGFYFGFQKVIAETDADWLVCYDDDAYPQQGTLAAFRSLSLTPDIAGVAAAVYLPSGAISEMNRPGFNPFANWRMIFSTAFKGRMGFHAGDALYAATKPVDIDASSFVGCFLRTSAIRSSLGLPRKELFIYADDIIYTFGIKQKGMRHVFAPNLKFTHDCGTLFNQQDIYKPLWRAFYTYRNRLEMYRVFSDKWFPLIFLLKVPAWFLKFKYYENKILFLRVVWLAVRDNLYRDFSRSHENVVKLTSYDAR